MADKEIDARLQECTLCPRECHANRLSAAGYCRTGPGFSIGSICIHRGEEPVLGGARGICNIFFTRCNLQCVYCQNYQISRTCGDVLDLGLSEPAVLDHISSVLATGVRHVGFVSPSHCIPQVERIITALGGRAPSRPVFVFNTNAYDKTQTIRSLEGKIDVYLPDLKYMDAALAKEFSDAPDYPQVAGAAIREMFRQKGAYLMLDDEGSAVSGLIIRHLVLPGHVENSLACLRFIAEELSPSVHLSLLSQYEPTTAVANHPTLGRRLHADEYERVIEEMHRLGFYRGWTQELSSAPNYNPDFRQRHPFDS